ncbi:hypothetical protein GCM10008094_13090 [Aidingimonas halophila]|nr:hypothetical protein GCM10008094_13090 [Aidingimonas halophila]
MRAASGMRFSAALKPSTAEVAVASVLTVVGRQGGIQVLALENPRRFKAQAEGQNLGAVHALPPYLSIKNRDESSCEINEANEQYCGSY